MDSVRGADKKPGQFRVNQNWLGPERCEIDQCKAGVLHTLRQASGRQSTIWVFRDLLNCAEGRGVL